MERKTALSCLTPPTVDVSAVSPHNSGGLVVPSAARPKHWEICWPFCRDKKVSVRSQRDKALVTDFLRRKEKRRSNQRAL